MNLQSKNSSPSTQGLVNCVYPQSAYLLHAQSIPDMENDCACPDTAFTLQSMQPVGVRYVKMATTHIEKLPNDHYLLLSPHAPSGPSVLNKAAWDRWQSFVLPQALDATIDEQLAAQMLIHPIGRLPQPQEGQAETLTAWIHITNACNLECPYCYVRKSSARMSLETGVNAVESIFRTAVERGFKRVKLKYAGGEATLHFKLVRHLHDRAAELARETGLALKEVVLSNGVHLRDEDAAWMQENGVRLMISVDGVGELHNQQRPMKGGKVADTFKQVEQTVDRLIERGMKPYITMTITGLNAHGSADVAQWAMLDRDLPTSFNFYRSNPLSTPRADLDLEEQAIIDGLLAAYDCIEQDLPTRPFLDGLLDRVQSAAHTHTCGVGQSYLVITHTGKLAQCQMHLDSPVSQSLDGDLLLPVASGFIRNISVDEKEGCRDCEFRYRCSGGCPIMTYAATGRWDVQSPNCRIYKTLYPAAMRLEGLRLLKTNGLFTPV